MQTNIFFLFKNEEQDYEDMVVDLYVINRIFF